MFYPPGHDVLYMMFRYLFNNYDIKNYVSSTVGAVKGHQIIDGTGAFVGLSDENGVVTWQQVA